jgi:plastocyanin
MANREGDRADGRAICDGVSGGAVRRRAARSAPRLAALLIGLAALGSFCSVATAAPADAFRARIEAPDGSPIVDAVVALAPLGGSATTRADSPPAKPPRATMDQLGLAFVPHVLAVAAGTVVDFPNSDQVRHSIYSFSAAKRFEVKLYRGFEAPPIRFETPGLVVLGCNIHDQMLGFVYVLEAPFFGVSDGDGAVEIRDVPPGRYRLELRHPRIDESLVVEREIELPSAAALVIPLGERPPPRPPARTDVDPLQSLFGEPAR